MAAIETDLSLKLGRNGQGDLRLGKEKRVGRTVQRAADPVDELTKPLNLGLERFNSPRVRRYPSMDMGSLRK